MLKRICAVVAWVLMGLAAGTCGDDAGNEECAPDNSDGSSACGAKFCEANTYCENDLLDRCEAGCASVGNCASGTYCDKSGAGSNDIGVCRSCEGSATSNATSNTTTTTTGMNSACADVQGNYTLGGLASNPSDCDIVSISACSVVEDGNDQLTFNCGEGMTYNCGIDRSTCACSFSATVDGGVVAAITVDFEQGSLNATAGGVLCEYAFE